MVVFFYVIVRQNTAQPSETSDNELERSLSPHSPLKPGAYFKLVIFNQKERSDLVN